MLFQGEEFASSSPFVFFADHRPKLASAVSEGRADFFTQFRSMATAEMQQLIPDPENPDTFERCKLDFNERHADVYAIFFACAKKTPLSVVSVPALSTALCLDRRHSCCAFSVKSAATGFCS